VETPAAGSQIQGPHKMKQTINNLQYFLRLSILLKMTVKPLVGMWD